ncbi:MAG: hypothetical protein HQL32_07655 [Planctomycetes bacterium]|nr:hypothetical protein [Planctomycetota bacterium]
MSAEIQSPIFYHSMGDGHSYDEVEALTGCLDAPVVTEGGSVILDLGEAPSLSGRTLGFLLHTHLKMKKKGGELIVVSLGDKPKEVLADFCPELRVTQDLPFAALTSVSSIDSPPASVS